MPSQQLQDQDYNAFYVWFRQMQSCVRAIDYERAKPLFNSEVIGFGTYQEIMFGLENLALRQWHNVWPSIREFTFDLDQLHLDGDGAVAWGACPWSSQGFKPDGTTFYRPGRVTVAFRRNESGKWLATHTHFSLYPPKPTDN